MWYMCTSLGCFSITFLIFDCCSITMLRLLPLWSTQWIPGTVSTCSSVAIEKLFPNSIPFEQRIISTTNHVQFHGLPIKFTSSTSTNFDKFKYSNWLWLMISVFNSVIIPSKKLSLDNLLYDKSMVWMEVISEKTLVSIPLIALCERFICSTVDKYASIPSNRYVNLFDDASNSFRLTKESKAYRLRVSNKLLLALNICEFNLKCSFGIKVLFLWWHGVRLQWIFCVVWQINAQRFRVYLPNHQTYNYELIFFIYNSKNSIRMESYINDDITNIDWHHGKTEVRQRFSVRLMNENEKTIVQIIWVSLFMKILIFTSSQFANKMLYGSPNLPLFCHWPVWIWWKLWVKLQFSYSRRVMGKVILTQNFCFVNFF